MIAPTLLVLDDNCESHGDSAWEFIAVPVPCCHIEPPDVVVVQERSGFFHTCWPGLFSISRMPLFGFELEDIFGSRLLSFRPLVGREVSILQARMSRTKVTFCSHTTSTLGLNSGWIVSIPSLHTARIVSFAGVFRTRHCSYRRHLSTPAEKLADPAFRFLSTALCRSLGPGLDRALQVQNRTEAKIKSPTARKVSFLFRPGLRLDLLDLGLSDSCCEAVRCCELKHDDHESS